MDQKRYRIVYEDEHIIVVDKPAGMLVIPTPNKETNTLTDLLNRELDARGVEANAYPCHRIDRETSGIIVYAKGKKAQALMMDVFKHRAVKKRYIAFVHGALAQNRGTFSGAIFNRNKKRKEPATTHYTVIEKRAHFTVVEAEPVTGRTNQIRIHFANAGHPLVGESVYAFRKDFRLRFKRAALHAEEISFLHPVTREKVSFTAPIPDDMARLL